VRRVEDREEVREWWDRSEARAVWSWVVDRMDDPRLEEWDLAESLEFFGFFSRDMVESFISLSWALSLVNSEDAALIDSLSDYYD
jgi:hypothetical protein